MIFDLTTLDKKLRRIQQKIKTVPMLAEPPSASYPVIVALTIVLHAPVSPFVFSQRSM